MRKIFKFIKRILLLGIILGLGFAIYSYTQSKNIAIVIHGDDAYVNSYVRNIYRPFISYTQFDPNMENIDESISYLSKADGIIFAGGKDFDPSIYGSDNYDLLEEYNTEEDQADLKLLEAALDKNIPTLGICRGAQLINIYFGGSLS